MKHNKRTIAIVGGIIALAAVFATIVYKADSKTKADKQETTLSLIAALNLDGAAQENAINKLIETNPAIKDYAKTLELLGMTWADYEAELRNNMETK